MPRWSARYSGPDRSGTCVCGHRWDDHHLQLVQNKAYIDFTREAFVPEACEFYGTDEMGGLDSEGNAHCFNYKDSEEEEA